MPYNVQNQSDLEAALIAQQQAEARQMITIVKALIAQSLQVHEVDFDALAAKVNSVNTLLDGDEANEGYQAFAALTAKLNTVEATGVNNTASIANLQNALNTQIATLNSRVDTVETEARTGREALDARITTLRSEYEAHVAAKLTADNTRDTRLDDHQARIEALEASKALIEGRLTVLETDNTANKSAIAGIQTSLSAQADALKQELQRAQAAELQLQTELATERGRIDQLTTNQASFATHQNISDANEQGATAFVNAAWAEAGITMPAGLPMPDGSTSN